MGFLANRLQKRLKHIGKWARRTGVSCFRVYSHDIPEYPIIADLYEGRAAVWISDRTRDDTPEAKERFRAEVIGETLAGLNLKEEDLFLKERHPGGQYRRREASRSQEIVVNEGGLKFLVSLSDYHDTGLFLDHRQTRALAASEAAGKTFLNLFCYTGSFTVYAAAAGAKSTVSVDLSGRYLDWAQRNLELNGLDSEKHTLIEDDVLAWLKDAASAKERFDIIVCDPPTFSNSKMTKSVLDIQRDHVSIITDCLRLLNPGGKLFFSNNKRNFILQVPEYPQISVKELTKQTVPLDFESSKPHKTWLFTKNVLRVPSSK